MLDTVRRRISLVLIFFLSILCNSVIDVFCFLFDLIRVLVPSIKCIPNERCKARVHVASEISEVNRCKGFVQINEKNLFTHKLYCPAPRDFQNITWHQYHLHSNWRAEKYVYGGAVQQFVKSINESLVANEEYHQRRRHAGTLNLRPNRGHDDFEWFLTGIARRYLTGNSDTPQLCQNVVQ